ncbi:hypothetical protein EYF80_031414 [Liparis tanakae]|uniref:Uncharacterized protein n=1 Tax=Liparis tanakae TaxID=230148 RepID=A0A4Z2GYH9_9TELE|nr:hypothetical protein EYF80_031414 [Liparis tanakae]
MADYVEDNYPYLDKNKSLKGSVTSISTPHGQQAERQRPAGGGEEARAVVLQGKTAAVMLTWPTTRYTETPLTTLPRKIVLPAASVQMRPRNLENMLVRDKY